MNRNATFWDGPGGYREYAFKGFVPYDLIADEIGLGEDDMIPFALDATAHPGHCQGKALRLQGQLMGCRQWYEDRQDGADLPRG